MLYLSKSKYCGLWQCAKIAWLRQYKPEAAVIDEAVQARFNAGNVVGDLAMGLFGDFVEVTVRNGDKLDLAAMIDKTSEEMAKGTQNICEASFSYNGLYCAVDILRKEGSGWAIYEVKSSTKHQRDDGSYEDDREVYIADVSYQKPAHTWSISTANMFSTARSTYQSCSSSATLQTKSELRWATSSPLFRRPRRSSYQTKNLTSTLAFTARIPTFARSGNTAPGTSPSSRYLTSTASP